MIRRVAIKDFEQCRKIAEGFFDRYPSLIPNHQSIKQLFSECVSGSRNFAMASEIDGVIVGCIFALSFDHIWAQKQSSSVIMWSCEKSGDGVRMLRAYRDWIDSRPVIRIGGFQFDIDLDVRVHELLVRFGFERKGGCFLRIKGGAL